MIVVYITNGCAYCEQVKKYLTLKKKPFTVVNMDEDPDARQKWASRGIMTAPIIQKDDLRYVVGWQPAQLAELIK